MVNDEYQFPSIPVEQQPLNAEFSDVPFQGEVEPTSPYSRALQIADEIYTLRATADETVIPRRLARRVFEKSVQAIGLSFDQNAPFEDRLIDIEAEAVGDALPKPDGVQSQRVWIGKKRTDGVIDLYYEINDKLGTSLAHYIISESGIEKLSKSGRVVPLMVTGNYNEEAVVFHTLDIMLGVTKNKVYSSKQSDYDLAA